MNRRRTFWLVAIVAAFAMLAAACGSDDEGSDGGDETPEATEEATEEATGEATEEATEDPTEEATEDATEEATEEAAGDLVTTDDSGRLVVGECPEGENNEDPSIGVAADSVNFAVVTIDFAPLAQLGFAASDRNVLEFVEPYIDQLNEAGGICGRTIDFQGVDYDIIAGEGGEACLEVTEDRSNLVVFGQGGFEEATCIAESGTVTYSQQDFGESQIPEDGIHFNRNPSVEVTYETTAETFLPDMEGQTVGVWYGAVFPVQGDAVEERVFPILDEAGINYLPFRTDSIGPSDPEGGAILQAAVTEYVSANVDSVLGFTQTTNHVGLQGEMAAQGLTPTWLWSNVGANTANELFAEAFGVEDIADGERMLTYTAPPADASEQPAAVSCNEEYTELTGETIEPGTFDYMAVTNMCNQIDLLAALLTLAGPELTQETLIAAFEAVPAHPMGPQLGTEQWGPGERFGGSTMAVLVYDGSTNSYSLEGDTFSVD